MRKPFLLTSLILCVFVLAPPVFAVSYSASVSFDMTTLMFSGIPVNTTTVIPPGTFDPFIFSVEAEQRDTFLFEHSRNGAFLQHDTFSPTWVDGALTEHLAGVGTVTALASPTELSSSINLLSAASGSSLMVRHLLLTATQAGSLTVSINYAISHSGVPVGDLDFSSSGRAGLSVGNFADVNQQRDFRDLRLSNVPPFDAPRDQRGTASVSYLFNTGQSVPLSLFTVVNGTVPLPGMFWPTLGLFVGLAGLVARRRSIVTP